MLILQVLLGGKKHGWGISSQIALLSHQAVLVEEGSLYPSLYRMETKGWVVSEWGQSELNRKAKIYEITPAGRKQLEAEKTAWARHCAVIGQILYPA